jgi:hypothetical protein
VEASPRVEFFFSPGSRYSYLAASQMALLEAETGCTVDWRPVNGGEQLADAFAWHKLSVERHELSLLRSHISTHSAQVAVRLRSTPSV